MKELLFSTGNPGKFFLAHSVCKTNNIDLKQIDIEIPEIQDEDPEKVALDKAAKAFEIVGKPVIISDDSWSFAGLGGFPGVYMHSINEWFKPEDFIRLASGIKNRDVTLTQYLVYTDDSRQKVFTRQTKGKLLEEVRGENAHASHTVITLEGDDGLSIAEIYDKGEDRSKRRPALIWHDFVEWYKNVN